MAPNLFGVDGNPVTINSGHDDPIGTVITDLEDDAINLNYPWIATSSQPNRGVQLNRPNGTVVYAVDPYSDDDNTTFNDEWKTLMNGIYKNSNITHLLDSHLKRPIEFGNRER